MTAESSPAPTGHPAAAGGSLLARRRSPLHHLAQRLSATGSPETVTLTELPFRTLVDLRADHRAGAHSDRRADSDGDGPARWAAALGVPLPEKAGEVNVGESRQVLWLGPGWWLVSDEPEPAAGLEASLATTLRQAAPGTSVVDVSAQYTTLRLAGRHARTVLEHGCSLDLHPRAFPVGSCAQTMLAKAQVILQQTGESEYRILVRGSFADYLARWLLDAMTEYVT